jgi:hypothetical protein
MVAGLIAGVAGIAGGLLSSGAQASEARKARAAEQKRIEAQYKYDTSVDNFNWKQTERQYKFAKKETGVARQNQENNLRYQEDTAARDYGYTLAIRNFEYANQVRAYNQSEKVYGDQRRLNAIASQDALNAESRRYNELIKGMSFQHQDMLVKGLQEAGAVEARAGQGVSAGRLTGGVMASYGRNQAIMAANLLSAERESLANEKQVYNDQYQADFAADARRMLSPLLAPTPMAPLSMPRATLLDPLRPERGPAPMKGTNTVRTPSGLSIANNFLNAGLSTFAAFGGRF